QNLMSEEEFPRFLAQLRIPLPSSFRITGSRSHAKELKDLMVSKYFPGIENFVDDAGEVVQVPKPIPWYPDDLAWSYSASRTALKKSPQLATYHKFLVAETEVGNISRQEVVSMIPVLLLDVKPEHSVLDMCAAPGSKTAQIIEAIHANDEPIPSGLVVANDAEQARAYMLVRQTKRLQSPCLVVTNHEAQFLPFISLAGAPAVQAGPDAPATSSRVLRFDRILGDVPCSGDGTMRKNKLIWNSWKVGNGNGLHKLQLQILIRGIEMLKVGGQMVYSTCSFNPIENEAVVAAALRHCGGTCAIELVDASKRLPQLERRNGICTWKVMSGNGTWYSSWDDVPAERRAKLAPTMFAQEDNVSLGLDKCIRLYPHLQDTGGFFVAVIRKTGPFGKMD
ncbi:S-adenosyl-L-methionine-dependent methyltransferase, partial [Blyttiomyces helicus]